MVARHVHGAPRSVRLLQHLDLTVMFVEPEQVAPSTSRRMTGHPVEVIGRNEGRRRRIRDEYGLRARRPSSWPTGTSPGCCPGGHSSPDCSPSASRPSVVGRSWPPAAGAREPEPGCGVPATSRAAATAHRRLGRSQRGRRPEPGARSQGQRPVHDRAVVQERRGRAQRDRQVVPAVAPERHFRVQALQLDDRDGRGQHLAPGGDHDVYYFGEGGYFARAEQRDGFEDLDGPDQRSGLGRREGEIPLLGPDRGQGPEADRACRINWHVEDALFVNMDMVRAAGFDEHFVDSGTRSLRASRR